MFIITKIDKNPVYIDIKNQYHYDKNPVYMILKINSTTTKIHTINNNKKINFKSNIIKTTSNAFDSFDIQLPSMKLFASRLFNAISINDEEDFMFDERKLYEYTNHSYFELKEFTKFSDEAWENAKKRDLLEKKIANKMLSPKRIEFLSELDDAEWENVKKRKILKKNIKKDRDIQIFANLSDQEYKKSIKRKLLDKYNADSEEDMTAEKIALLSKLDDKTFDKISKKRLSEANTNTLKQIIERNYINYFNNPEETIVFEHLSENEWANIEKRKLFESEITKDERTSEVDIYAIPCFAELNDNEFSNIYKYDLLSLKKENSFLAYEIATLAELSEEEWQNVLDRDLLNYNKRRIFEGSEIKALSSINEEEWQNVLDRDLLNYNKKRIFEGSEIKILSSLNKEEWQNVLDRNLLYLKMEEKPNNNRNFLHQLKENMSFFPVSIVEKLAKLNNSEWDTLLKANFLEKKFTNIDEINAELQQIQYKKADKEAQPSPSFRKLDLIKVLKIIDPIKKIKLADIFKQKNGTKISYMQAHSNNGYFFWKRIETNKDGSKKIVIKLSSPAKISKNETGDIIVNERSKTKIKIETDIKYSNNGNLTIQKINGISNAFESEITKNEIIIREPLSKKIINKKNYEDLIDDKNLLLKNETRKFIAQIPANELHYLLKNNVKMKLAQYSEGQKNGYWIKTKNLIKTYTALFTTLHEIGHSKFDKLKKDNKLKKTWEKESRNATPSQSRETSYFGLYSPSKVEGLGEICSELNAIINTPELTTFNGTNLKIRSQQLMEVYPETCTRLIELLYKE